MTHQILHSIANENSGGLSVSVSGKYTSVRHELAKVDGKLTAGEAAKKVSKALKIKVSAKELKEAFTLIFARQPEWHHSGFYKAAGRKSTMGRTFFFTEEQCDKLVESWATVAVKKAEKEAQIQVKRETVVFGFYYQWQSDYGGNYGKKRNFKVLFAYKGSALSIPSNFTSCSEESYMKAKELEGKKYFGWDEPKISEF